MSRGFVLGLALAVGMSGCAAKKQLTADQYFDQATKNFREGALTLAVEQFRELLDQHPFSPYNEEAELKVAHAQYLSGDYTEAIVALTDFQRRYPTSPHLPFVGYCLGMCYLRQMDTIDRDQTAAERAHAYFLTVSQQYAESPFAELARQELAFCRENLAGHELYVARFYARRGNTKAAEIRLLTMAARYPETTASADGLQQLASLYRGADNEEKTLLAYQALVAMHPRTPQGAAARRRLQQAGHASSLADGGALAALLAVNGRPPGPGGYEPAVPDPREGSRTVPSAKPPLPGLAPAADPLGGEQHYY